METDSARCLINSISRFIHLLTCQNLISSPTQTKFENMSMLMKHLKPFIDEIINENLNPDQTLLKKCEILDIDVHDARECLERCSPETSKILSVRQSELLLKKIRDSSLEICRVLCRLLRASPSSSTLAGVELCKDLMKFMQELQNWQMNRISKHIEQALSDQSESSLLEIIESLGLKSNQDLLMERISIEKERMKSQSDQIHQANNLISLIYDHMLKNGYFDSGYGFSIPSYFRCPLSLELMSDPVIVASGQTFERACIQKWIDHGLNTCPKTGEPLSHTDFIPNYTIKAMIVSWFKENSHKEESSVCQSSEIKNADSPEHSYTHSRTQSASTAKSECFSPEMLESQSSNYLRTDSFRSSDMGSDETTTCSYVEKQVEDLKSESIECQTSAAYELRLLTKHNMENRVIIRKCNAVVPLIELMYSESKKTQEHAVTALLNLSINEENKAMIAETQAVDSLIHVLKSGNDSAKENSAATLFSLAVLEQQKIKIGRSGAVKALVNLLGTGSTDRGKKDALAALFVLSICHENKARIVQAGAVKYLVELLDLGSGLVDKAIALLTNLVTVSEGRFAVVRESGIPMIIEVLDCGSRRGKENAASALLQLCLHSEKFCTLVLEEGAVPPLVALSQTGTPRAREKAQQLLSHFRSQRESATNGKRKIIKY